MKMKLPGYRSQIVLLVLLVIMIAVILMRDLFLSNISSYQEQINALASEERVRDMYREILPGVDSTHVEKFNHQVENILTDLHKIELAGDFYTRDIRLYTLGIVIFTALVSLAIFFFAFGLITRPLARLMDATRSLTQGDFSVRVHESRLSPLNQLIVSFNSMTGELEANREKLIEAEKQVIWKEMARAMAHEIKNPLTPIRLSVERLAMKSANQSPDLPDVLEKSLHIINEEVENLQSLVTAFSGFAKMPESRPLPYDLNTQLREIVEQYQDDAEVELDLADDLKTIDADPMQIKQVLVNLIQNALQASAKVPHVVLRTEVRDRTCRIQVQDDGPGIPFEDLGKIFEPYFTTKKKGTGLGLALSRRILQQHGGEIQVSSTPGEGTTFTLTLPCNRIAPGALKGEDTHE